MISQQRIEHLRKCLDNFQAHNNEMGRDKNGLTRVIGANAELTGEFIKVLFEEVVSLQATVDYLERQVDRLESKMGELAGMDFMSK
jgi:seryl-tRNA synthetase